MTDARRMNGARLILDGPRRGTWNMAADEWLLEQTAASGRPTLRFYEWSEPTLSLGYFQALAQRESHEPSRQAAIVRRSTGGGAILHHHDLTYSIAIPLADRWSQAADTLYDLFHHSLIRALDSFGVRAESCPATLHPLGEEPFLCFQRRAKGDVLVASHKIAGSAQRRRRGALLQHGSVLLARSPYAPELPGLAELHGEIELERLRALWLQEVTKNLIDFENFQPADWNSQEIEAIDDLERRRIDIPSWLRKR